MVIQKQHKGVALLWCDVGANELHRLYASVSVMIVKSVDRVGQEQRTGSDPAASRCVPAVLSNVKLKKGCELVGHVHDADILTALDLFKDVIRQSPELVTCCVNVSGAAWVVREPAGQV